MDSGAGGAEEILDVCAGRGIPAGVGRHIGAHAATDEHPCPERGSARKDPPDRIAHRAQLFVMDGVIFHEGKRSGVARDGASGFAG